MTSHQPPARDGRAPGPALAVGAGAGQGGGVRRGRLVPRLRRVSAWQVAADLTGRPDPHQRYAAYASGLAVMWVLVGVLKLAGAAVALAAVRVRPGRPGRSLVDLDIIIPAQRRRTGIEPA
ncbi:MAG TPA: hypothetical protein VF468_17070 [Actinomycetota bacterium]|nr:hypothetical protein [Actinomycetota bacterium]